MPAVDMKAKVEKIEDSRAHIQVEVEPEEVHRALERAYRKVVREVAIPGFRRGRAPRAILERHVGRQVLVEEALDDLLPQAYAGAVEVTGIEPIDRPNISDISFEEGKPLHFAIDVEVKPEVDPGDYLQVRVERDLKPVKTEQVDQVLETLRERHAQQVAVDDPNAQVGEGDIVTIDFEGTLDGEAIEGGSGEDFVLEVGSGHLLESFESQLVGMKVGETRDIKVDFPEDYPADPLKGQTAEFRVTVKDLKRKEIPDLDDELAKTAGPFETLAELRKDVSERLERMAGEEADSRHRQAVIQAVVEQAQVQVPQVLVDRRQQQLREDFERRLAGSGLSLEEFLSRRQEEPADFEAGLRERAEADVKTDLVLEAIARREGFTPSEADFQREARILAEGYGQPPEQMRGLMRHPDVRSEVENSIILRKTVDFLTGVARGLPADEARQALEQAAEEATEPTGGTEGATEPPGENAPAGPGDSPEGDDREEGAAGQTL